MQRTVLGVEVVLEELVGAKVEEGSGAVTKHGGPEATEHVAHAALLPAARGCDGHHASESCTHVSCRASLMLVYTRCPGPGFQPSAPCTCMMHCPHGYRGTASKRAPLATLTRSSGVISGVVNTPDTAPARPMSAVLLALRFLNVSLVVKICWPTP